ncbi:UDP-glucuronic acid decarboxylase 3 [Artemisia annua]|uniref:UDP-glucuronic acid decarboxylase 3 n=1 Tax=Artemisia annua TaxID=35608 RepID=A0A2U1MA67_ARTAN|nr:UDP-glucuronic acid decarboxylase 3 [Artemisia annua]
MPTLLLLLYWLRCISGAHFSQSPGTQPRSFCYISDMCFTFFSCYKVDGLIQLMEGSNTGPINIGNPGEFTMIELAETVKENCYTITHLESDDGVRPRISSSAQAGSCSPQNIPRSKSKDSGKGIYGKRLLAPPTVDNRKTSKLKPRSLAPQTGGHKREAICLAGSLNESLLCCRCGLRLIQFIGCLGLLILEELIWLYRPFVVI